MTTQTEQERIDHIRAFFASLAPDGPLEHLRKQGDVREVDVSAAMLCHAESSFYVSLHVEIPGDLGVRPGPETRWNGYRRQRVDRGPDGRWPDEIRIEFAPATAHTIAKFIGICTSESGPALNFVEFSPSIFLVERVPPVMILFLGDPGDR